MSFLVCKLEPIGDFCVCGKCGRPVRIRDVASGDCAKVHANCKADPAYIAYLEELKQTPREQRPAKIEAATPRVAKGLGDYTERMLESIGITKERYAEVKEKFGFAPTCNCNGRKEWLNKVGRYFGFG